MRSSPEHGAVLIHVAVFLLVATALSAFVLDYGVMWASRTSIQTSADAAALAAAVHLMTVDDSDEDGARTSAIVVGTANGVWAQAPDIQTGDVTFPACPPGSGGTGKCVKVDAYRTQSRNNPLPVFFARLLGVSDQGVRGTATAQMTSGNAVQCIKPWIVADKWVDNDESGGGWAQGNTFTPGVDTYSAPGFRSPSDIGVELVLKAGTVGEYSSGWTQEIDFGISGSSAYQDELEGCPDWVPTVAVWDGQYKCDAKGDTPDPTRGCVSVKTGMSAGPTSHGVGTIVQSDPDAVFVGDHVEGGCMEDHSCVNPNGVSISPRIVPIALFDTATYVAEAAACSGTGCVAKISNIVGFFVEGMCDEVYHSPPPYCGSHPDKAVVGRFVDYPGTYLGTGGATTSKFTLMVRLVR
jgi:hypothetical protein